MSLELYVLYIVRLRNGESANVESAKYSQLVTINETAVSKASGGFEGCCENPAFHLSRTSFVDA
jgi:hypothetical protein